MTGHMTHHLLLPWVPGLLPSGYQRPTKAGADVVTPASFSWLLMTVVVFLCSLNWKNFLPEIFLALVSLPHNVTELHPRGRSP